jgi:puromycin-sensitive aminopeptidase
MSRLANDVRAERYALQLQVDPSREPFSGEVAIELRAPPGTRAIEVHSVDLEWLEWSARDAQGDLSISRAEERPERETRRLHFSRALAAETLELRIRYRGLLRGDLRGLYRARSGSHRYALTQLEAPDARRFFPCLDEPDKKARFRVSVTTPARNQVISNAPIEREEVTRGRRKTVHFDETPPLSTYLLALVVGELESSPIRRCGRTPIRIWAVPGRRAQMGFALDAAQAALERLERYFGLPYPYAKLDLIAAPDFEFGAMENAGAVLFRETLLLTDPKTVTHAERKRVAEVIAHELAHMWFGDLVTMAWWDDLWLNEAFATWMAYSVVDDWQPSWKLWLDFQRGRASAFELDALEHTHPIYVEVRTPADATENFDRITYEKGAAVVRMIERWIGHQSFRRGVRAYIRAHREGNARGVDLWSALEKASGQPIAPIVRHWIEESGFPLLQVSGAQSPGKLQLLLRQERFRARAAPRPAHTSTPWPIPLSIALREQGRRPRIARALVDQAEQEITIEASGKLRWFYANAEESGFYRPLHGSAERARLREHFAELRAVERMGLLDHEWAGVRAGRSPLEFLLDLLPELGDESEPNVLETVESGILAWLRDPLLPALPAREAARMRALLASVFGPAFRSLGWRAKRGEDPRAPQRRAVLLRIAGGIAEDPELLAGCAQRIDPYLADRSTLDADLAGPLVFLAARGGSPRLYASYRTISGRARTPQERNRFQFALAEFRDPELCRRTLELVLEPEVRTQDVIALLARLLFNPVSRADTWRFIRDRWEPLSARIPPASASGLVSALTVLGAAHRREVAAFFRDHPLPAARRALKQALERFRLDAELLRRTRPQLRAWLSASPDRPATEGAPR